jgi:hypothetical protein
MCGLASCSGTQESSEHQCSLFGPVRDHCRPKSYQSIPSGFVECQGGATCPATVLFARSPRYGGSSPHMGEGVVFEYYPCRDQSWISYGLHVARFYARMPHGNPIQPSDAEYLQANAHESVVSAVAMRYPQLPTETMAGGATDDPGRCRPHTLWNLRFHSAFGAGERHHATLSSRGV